jgi:phage terminase small subunit
MLTAKQKVWIEEYLRSLNATDAARRAGYKHPHTIGSRNLNHPNIRKELQKLMDKRSERLQIDADFVLKELHALYQRVIQEVKPALNSKTGKPITDDDGNSGKRSVTVRSTASYSPLTNS